MKEKNTFQENSNGMTINVEIGKKTKKLSSKRGSIIT